MHSATASGAVCRVAQAIGASIRSPGVNLTGVALVRLVRRDADRRLGAIRFGVTFLAATFRDAVDFAGAIRLAGVIRLVAMRLAAVFDAVALRLGAIRLAAILRDAVLAEVFLAPTVFTAPRAGRLAADLAAGFLFLDAEEFAA